MALLDFESWDYWPITGTPNYGAADYVPIGVGSFAGAGSIGAPGRFGGQCLQLSSFPPFPSLGKLIRKQINTFFFGTAVLNNPGANTMVLFYDGVSGDVQISVQLTSFGVIQVYRREPGFATLLGSSAVGAYPFTSWFYLEIGGFINGSTGSVTVKVNTVTKIALTNINTQFSANPWIDTYAYASTNEGGGCLFDDAYICDNTGSQNNTFLGNVRASCAFPTGAGASTDFSIGGSEPTNWQAASNNKIDDSSYVFDDVVNDKDLYTMQSISNLGSIFGVQVKGFYRQDNATQRFAQNVLKSGATTTMGGIYATNTTYGMQKDIYELDPNTSAGWLQAAVNSIEVGPSVEA